MRSMKLLPTNVKPGRYNQLIYFSILHTHKHLIEDSLFFFYTGFYCSAFGLHLRSSSEEQQSKRKQVFVTKL